MDIEPSKIQEIFTYLAAQDELVRADGAFVFGRADPLLAQVASEIYHKSFITYILFTGGLGKDSGVLSQLGIAEADFLAACTNLIYKVPVKDIYREVLASNGAENAGLGLKAIINNRLPIDALIVIAHATPLRRLAATLEQEMNNMKLNIKLIKRATPYNFNPSGRIDQLEACSELVKLEDYAKKGWCRPQIDLPQELIAYAKESLAATK